MFYSVPYRFIILSHYLFYHFINHHRISSSPCALRYSLVLLKCLFPKKPLYAERGEGCADVNTRCLLRSMNAPFRWA